MAVQGERLRKLEPENRDELEALATADETPRGLWVTEFYRTAVGKKYVMAITGIIGLGYVAAHMIGNLKFFLGPDELNHYGEWLRALGEPALPRTVTLWGMRSVLIGALLLHLHATVTLTLQNRRARPHGYDSKRHYKAATFAARTMRWSGVFLLVYIVFHLADLTWGFANPDYVRGDPYGNLVASLSRPAVAIFYIAANLVLAVHLFHGAWSFFQSLGWSSRRFNPWRRHFATAFAVVVSAGFLTVPVAIASGLVA